MKKAILSIILSAIFIVFSNNQVEAQCPTGSTTQTFEFTVGGCVWFVDLCYKCPVTSSPNWVSVKSIKLKDPNCTPTVSPPDVKNLIVDEILDNNFQWLMGLCEDEIPPCGVDTKTFTFRDYACWYVRTDINGNQEYYACFNSGYCNKDFEVCWDATTGPSKVSETGWYLSGDQSDCLGTYPGNPPPGQITDCFMLSNCNQ